MRLSNTRRMIDWIVCLLALALMTLISAGAAAQVNLGAITVQEARVYAEWLDLSEDERLIARSIHDAYMARAQEMYYPLLKKSGGAVNEALNASNRPAGWDYDSHGLFVKAYRLEDESIAALEQLDATYFDDLGALVDDEAKIERLKLRRARQVFKRDRSELPGGNVDLFALLDSVEGQLKPAVQEQISAWRQRWEPHYVELIRVASNDYRLGNFLYAKYADAASRLQDEQFGNRPSGHWQRIVDEFHERDGYRPIHDRKVGLKRFVEDRLADLKGLVDPDLAYEMETIYLQESYPEVYPDPGSAEQLYRAALELEDLNDAQREAIRVLRREFLFAHDRLSREIRDALSTLRREGLLPDGYSKNWREVQQAVGEEREQLNADQIHRLSPILTPEQLRRLPAWDFELNPPLRPWSMEQEERRRVHGSSSRAIDTPRPGAPTFEITDD